MNPTDAGHPIDFRITPQPNEITCGPTCLHAMYQHHGLDVPLEEVIRLVPQLPEGGTLTVMLALDALRRGLHATLVSFNLQLFDPTWFRPGGPTLSERLMAQTRLKNDWKLRFATEAYLEFLALGGELRMSEMTPPLISGMLAQGDPLIVALSGTWLYQAARERPLDNEPDDLAGEPMGHFVILHGLDAASDRAWIADPFLHMPEPGKHHYQVSVDRLRTAILLGIVTYDAELLQIRRPGGISG